MNRPQRGSTSQQSISNIGICVAGRKRHITVSVLVHIDHFLTVRTIHGLVAPNDSLERSLRVD